MYNAGTTDFKHSFLEWVTRNLLHAEHHTPPFLTEAQSLACMGVRIPITLGERTPNQADIHRELVSQHLRLLLSATVGFSQIVTTCPSEPVLAEAAYHTLVYRRWFEGSYKTQQIDTTSLAPLPILARHMESTILDVGQRGETVAAILLLDARDRATTFPIDDQGPPGDDDGNYGDDEEDRYDGGKKRRIITVVQFLQALIGTSFVDTCLTSRPTVHTAEFANVPLQLAFADCFVYFNHFIKVRSTDMVN